LQRERKDRREVRLSLYGELSTAAVAVVPLLLLLLWGLLVKNMRRE